MYKIFLQRTLLIILSGALLSIACWSGYNVYTLSNERAEIKNDYGVLNNITYGLLSVNAWRDHLVKVVTNRIDDFEFTPDQEKALKSEVSNVLHAVVNKADSLVDKKQKTFKGKITKFAVKTFIDQDKIHAQVPVFAQTIVNELKKPKNKEKLKYLAQSKLQEFGTITYDSANDIKRVENMLSKYGVTSVSAFNANSDLLDPAPKQT